MGKTISRGSIPPDEPMFSGGVEIFSVRRRPVEQPQPDPDDTSPPASPTEEKY